MPITSTDIQYRLSGGAANSNPDASLGGAKSSELVPVDLFDDVSSAESAAGDTEYRIIYVHNNHGSLTLQNAVIWISANTTGSRIAIGLGASAINGTESTIANENTAPGGVTFSQPSSKGAGLSLGSIPPGQHKAVAIRRAVVAATPAANDTYTLSVEGDTAA
ncbi:hypothetical protein [Hydrogenophaga atypica]|uniref:Uncharacterized protein n=1 Tax=Hydrogenophaga atypica TaxID=249409 RepID=A0ABW2QIB2_9BURK